MSSAIVNLIGSELIDAKGQTIPAPQLPSDGALGIYFSAHWCPPCRMFTPQLADFYRKFKQTEAGSRLEIVFVSSDRDENAFKEYLADMPWLALPYSNRALKDQLSKKFKVQGIPTLVFVDGQTGKLITDSGREKVSKFPDGEGFPWHPVPLSQILTKGKLLKGSEEVDAETALTGKVKGIYFSAHWCPPCRAFTPELIATYNKLKEAGRNFEVIFVSSDRDEESMKEYYKEMPWLAVPYDDPRQDQLSENFGIDGIPSLVILDEKNELITSEGRSAVGSDKEGTKFPWIPEPFDELDDDNGSSLNSSACLIILTENKEDLMKQAKEVLNDIAPEYLAKVKATKDDAKPVPELRFFYEGPQSGDLLVRLKQFLTMSKGSGDSAEGAPAPTSKPRLWIINIPDLQFFELSATDDGSDPLADGAVAKVRQVVDDFQNEKLELKPISH